jgi:hypothetical protein
MANKRRDEIFFSYRKENDPEKEKVVVYPHRSSYYYPYIVIINEMTVKLNQISMQRFNNFDTLSLAVSEIDTGRLHIPWHISCFGPDLNYVCFSL